MWFYYCFSSKRRKETKRKKNQTILHVSCCTFVLLQSSAQESKEKETGHVQKESHRVRLGHIHRHAERATFRRWAPMRLRRNSSKSSLDTQAAPKQRVQRQPENLLTRACTTKVPHQTFKTPRKMKEFLEFRGAVWLRVTQKLLMLGFSPLFQVFSGPPTGLTQIVLEAADRPNIK